MKDPYSILGVSPSATDDEIKEAYRALARKYHPDNYTDDNPLKDLANEKMQEINEAYDEILKMRANAKKGESSSSGGQTGTGSAYGIYYEIRQKINARRFAEAERMIAEIPISNRGAEWHYLNSVLLMKRGYVNDAMRELEMACSMDPSNMEYQRAKQMFNQGAQGYGSAYYGDQRRRPASNSDACDCCMNLICLDCLCECMGGDLIRCI